MKLLLAMSLGCALAYSTAYAQVLPFDYTAPIHPYAPWIGNAEVGKIVGDATIDQNANTIALNGTLTLPSATWTATASQSALVPGPFPTVTRYTDTVTVTFSHSGLAVPFTVDPVVPQYDSGTTYFATADAPPPLSITINYSYTYKENGIELETGGGSYIAQGAGPGWFSVNVGGYPNEIGIRFSNFGLSPISSDPLFTVDPPHGATMAVYAPSLTSVPEPIQFCTLFGAGLLSLAFLRTSLSRRLANKAQ